MCSISRDNSPIQVQKAGRFFPLLVASFSACFSSTSRSLCHSTSTVAYFLQIHFLIGAAERRCCYAQSTEACAENTTHRKRWFVMGVVCGGSTEHISQTPTYYRVVFETKKNTKVSQPSGNQLHGHLSGLKAIKRRSLNV